MTTFVAILFALPKIILAAMVLTSIFGTVIFAGFLVDHIQRGPSRKWQGMSASSEGVVRGFVFCAITFVVGSISLLSKAVSW
jgi:hypothetical protein